MSISNTPIDLSLLPVPDAIEQINFEDIYQQRVQDFIDLFPADKQDEVRETIQLESEPAAKLLQENAYRETLLRQRINETVRRVLLAFAKGSDLDHIGAKYYVERLVVQQEDLTVTPPKLLIMESDEAFQERIQAAYDGLSIAGPKAAYEFHARSADGRVLDAIAVSPEPCEVIVYVLSSEGDGTASPELIDVVDKALNDEEIRPLADRVTVLSSTIVTYNVKASLHLKSFGPGRDIAVLEAERRVSEFVNRRLRQGKSVWLDKLDALLHVEGVERVEITEPANHVIIDESQAALCLEIEIVDADEEEG